MAGRENSSRQCREARKRSQLSGSVGRRRAAAPSARSAAGLLGHFKHHRLPAKQFAVSGFAAVAVVGVLTLSACGSQSAASPDSASKHGEAAPAIARSAATATAKVCIDPTRSSDAEFAIGVREALATALSHWAPSLPAGSPTTAVGAVPALSLFVRQVSTDSYSTENPVLDLEIPGIPALPAPPKITDPNLATDQLKWASGEQRWQNAVQNALKVESAEVTRLKSYPLDHSAGNYSAISGCTAALADQGVQDTSVRMLAASDLEEDRPAVGANYAGASMLIDVNCPFGRASSCTGRVSSWTTRLRREGMGPVTTVRADAAARTIESWLLGARP